MTVEHHALVADMPEYKDMIHKLKTTNTHFAKLMDEYHDLTKKIEAIENGGDSASDETEEDLKKHRIKLKDQLAAMLADEKDKEDGGCCGHCGCG